MSYIFEASGKTVWSPALRVGKLFVDMADSLSGSHGVPHGLSFMASDFVVLDVPVFAEFTRSLESSSVLTHQEYRALASGFVEICRTMLAESP